MQQVPAGGDIPIPFDTPRPVQQFAMPPLSDIPGPLQQLPPLF